MPCETVAPNPDDAKAFNAYIARFKAGLPVECAAVESIR